MILSVPASIVNFFREFGPSGVKYAADHVRRALAAMVVGVILSFSRRVAAGL